MVHKVCNTCQAKTVTKNTGRTCDVPACRLSFHYRCLGWSEVDIDALKKSKVAWTCPVCALNTSGSSSDSTSTVISGVDRLSLGQHTPHTDLQSITSLQKSVKALIKSNGETLQRLLDIERSILEIKQVHERVQRLEKEREQDKRRITELEARLQGVEIRSELAEEQARDCYVEIRGVPVLENEDLIQRVERLGCVLGAQVSREDISSCSRTRVISTAAERPRTHQPIVVRFVHKNKRDNFLQQSRARKDNPLTSEELQVQGTPSRIFVNEYLTSAKKNLLFRVKEHFKGKLKYQFVWVRDAKIMLRRDTSSPIIPIRNETDFLKLVS